MRERGGPKVFISDSNAAFGAALENLGLEKTVTHEIAKPLPGIPEPPRI